MDWEDIEYRFKGLYEGTHRALGHKDVRTIRECAEMFHELLTEVADQLEEIED